MTSQLQFGSPAARRSDPMTSQRASNKFRRDTLRHRLLSQYSGTAGLTDDEAAQRADVRTGGWKRCSDLRSLGLIASTGELKRSELTGSEAMVCAITFSGKRLLGQLATQ